MRLWGHSAFGRVMSNGQWEELILYWGGRGRRFTVRHDFSQTNCNAVAAIVATVLGCWLPPSVWHMCWAWVKRNPFRACNAVASRANQPANDCTWPGPLKRASNNNNNKNTKKNNRKLEQRSRQKEIGANWRKATRERFAELLVKMPRIWGRIKVPVTIAIPQTHTRTPTHTLTHNRLSWQNSSSNNKRSQS